MIHILQRIHNLVVPHCVVDSKEICEPVVFGGDVLTNERAFGAQLAMFNNKSEFENLLGVISSFNCTCKFITIINRDSHGVF